jgi:transcriptional regulator with GAF, ATPase, and Fis domain
LRERSGDIPLLVHYFSAGSEKNWVNRFLRHFQSAIRNLTNYCWPGNVRELQNVIERAVVLAKGSVVQIDNSMLQAEQATGVKS